jgi:hypothetical protein
MKKQDTSLMLRISKKPEYLKSKIVLGLDEAREGNFNAGEVIEVTQEELNQIGSHRWLVMENDNVNKNS